MNEDFSMRLQAYLDGELGAAERAQVESVLAQDPEARALERELRMVMSALRDADPVVSVPESREFYWSRIERAINASEAVAARQARPESTFAGWFRRALLPLSG
ncbi:MAG TPA: zf-HC2 domain-containing protein, partial [Rhodocyclaceae bacterium]|nr:zf-HC2 domain-containing protein [Rhodocyclaceae bacterium]